MCLQDKFNIRMNPVVIRPDATNNIPIHWHSPTSTARCKKYKATRPEPKVAGNVEDFLSEALATLRPFQFQMHKYLRGIS